MSFTYVGASEYKTHPIVTTIYMLVYPKSNQPIVVGILYTPATAVANNDYLWYL